MTAGGMLARLAFGRQWGEVMTGAIGEKGDLQRPGYKAGFVAYIVLR
jgi:hypothetical protein